MRCYCCTNEITPKNKSKEHIIPDALGGLSSTSNQYPTVVETRRL